MAINGSGVGFAVSQSDPWPILIPDAKAVFIGYIFDVRSLPTATFKPFVAPA